MSATTVALEALTAARNSAQLRQDVRQGVRYLYDSTTLVATTEREVLDAVIAARVEETGVVREKALGGNEAARDAERERILKANVNVIIARSGQQDAEVRLSEARDALAVYEDLQSARRLVVWAAMVDARTEQGRLADALVDPVGDL